MRPEKRESHFEKVAIGEFVNGEIVDIEYDMIHTFKGYQGAEDRVVPAARLVFELNGCKYPHRTRWMTFSYSEKANLYKNFILKLVENAQPDMDFDLDNNKFMKVKTLWAENNNFQNLESIFPLEAKVKADAQPEPEEMDLGDEPSMEAI